MLLAFLACAAYVVVEVILLPVAALRGRSIPTVRSVTFVVVLVVAVFLGLLVAGGVTYEG